MQYSYVDFISALLKQRGVGRRVALNSLATPLTLHVVIITETINSHHCEMLQKGWILIEGN